MAISFVKRELTTRVLLILSIIICFSIHVAVGQPIEWDGGIRGVLLVGKFRTPQGLAGGSAEDQRNTLITELVGRIKDAVGFYQGLNNNDLAGAGALLVYLRGTGSRTDQQIKVAKARAAPLMNVSDSIHTRRCNRSHSRRSPSQR